MADNFSEFAFTDSVRRMQEEFGTRGTYEKFETNPRRTELTAAENAFIAERDGFYVASVGENGWPYIQFRGGPAGFLKALGDGILAFADFRGNGQFITSGNVEATSKAVLFLMDYAQRKRLKIWTTSRVLRAADHPDLLARVVDTDYDATVERIFEFRVEAFDWNCPQHITPRYTAAEIKNAIDTDPAFLDLHRAEDE